VLVIILLIIIIIIKDDHLVNLQLMNSLSQDSLRDFEKYVMQRSSGYAGLPINTRCAKNGALL
jgi:ABC-type glucose/galactose transport system permease subunit